MRYLLTALFTTAYLITFAEFTSASLKPDEKKDSAKTSNPFEIKIDTEKYLTDNRGLFILNNFSTLSPSTIVKLHLPSGKVLTGIVKTTEMINNEIFKVFGEITNEVNTGFGFVLTKDGIFAGAVVYRDTETNFVIKYNEDLKGYILIADKIQGKKIQL
jgi:hypothetical protein